MNKNLSVLMVSLLTACATPILPAPIASPSPVASPTPTPSPSPTKPAEIVIDKKVFDACAKHSWKNRGVAPLSYFKEIATSYHKAYCSKQQFPKMGIDKDALLYYGLPQDLISTYTLLIGLGLRESTGNWCSGRDSTANNLDAMTAEAGAFQSSYNSMRAHPTLKDISYFYMNNLDACGDTKPKCSSANYGGGAGLDFQRLSKSCPQFTILYNAFLIRVLRKHFGPLNRKEAEFLPACKAMLKEIEKSPC